MEMKEKISALFLCADILDYPTDEHRVKGEFKLLADEDSKDFNFDEMQSEYIKIFLINATTLRCVPYASWWIDGKMSGDSLSKINEFYEECGYKFDAESMYKPGDHISFMIRFIAILAEDNRFEKIKEFAVFLTWMEDFVNSLKKATKIEDFQLAARISLDIINSLKEEECEEI
jgi:TorA maturation chaperone TorD